MRTNADLTAYLKSIHATTRTEVWTRVQVHCVAWEERKGSTGGGAGNQRADAITVYIPLDWAINLKPDDVIVKGLVTDEISSNFTITALKAKYPDSATVKSVDRHEAGSLNMRHIQVGAA